MATVTTTSASISDMLSNIQKLQVAEQALINQLDTYTSASGYVSSDPKITEFVNSINGIANSRIALFKALSSNADILQTGVSQSRIDLVSQMTLLQVVEDQLNQAKAKIEELQSTNDTKMRMVEINTYYGHRYEAQSKLMKKIIFICIPILIVFILKKKGMIPETISNYLIGIITAVGAFIIMLNVWDIYTRNNMNFNEYDWNYESPDTQTPSIWQYNKENMFNFDNILANLLRDLGLCVGEKCCAPGLTYDKKEMQCVAPPKNIGGVNPAAKQGFTTRCGGLKGSAVGTYFDDDKNTYNGISPYSYDLAYAPV